MSKFASLKVQQSRFSALKIENDDDDDEAAKKIINGNNTKTNNKKSKKTNKAGQQAQPPKQQQKDGEQQEKPADDWETWKKKDDEFTDELFREQLKKALLESKIETAKQQEQKQQQETTAKPSTSTTSKAVKQKPKVMSLDEFQKKYEEPKITTTIVVKDGDDDDENKYMKEIDKNLEMILRREKQAEDYKSRHENDSAEKYVCLQQKNELEKREEEIQILSGLVFSLRDELREVKTRNKQLATILAQGEMKEKSELLLQIDELTAIKLDLSDQVSQLHVSLEQEKSKVHQLESELKKLRAALHHQKH